MTAKRRVLAIALDAASAPLIDEWIADGSLPRLAKLRAEGLCGATRSVDGFFVGATWPSFYSGVSPARHGVYNLLRLRPGSYDIVECTAEDLLRRRPFWERLSEAGRRVIVLDVPLCPPSPALNGVQVVEWGCHDAVCGFCSSPAALGQDILRRHGAHPVGSRCDAVHRSAEAYRAFERDLQRGIRTKTAITTELMAREDWDFCIQVFSESHCAGHQAWHLHDPRHPAHAAAAAAGDPIRAVYIALDAAVGEIVDQAGPETTVIVLALHGMSYWFGAQLLLHEVLVRLGVTVPRRVPFDARLKRRLHAAVAPVWAGLPRSLKQALAPLRTRTQAALASASPAPALRGDPQRSRCFALHNGFAAGGIRLNLRNREPNGVLAPGAEADALCALLMAELRQLVDPRTRAPLVRDVWRTATRYRGELLDDLPDLVVEWADDAPLGAAGIEGAAGATVQAWSPTVGHLQAVNRYCRSGEHRPEGMFIARGPGLRAGRLERVVSVLDFAPTITRMLGCAPGDHDGALIEELAR